MRLAAANSSYNFIVNTFFISGVVVVGGGGLKM
jgi:hypothetical protein